MNVEDGFITLEVSEVARLGPSCCRRVRCLGAGRVTWLTEAIAWCYEDWCAQQHMDDDGMRHSKVWT